MNLTPLLLQTLPLLAEGKTSREMATILGISEHGADARVKRIMEIFDVHRREQVVSKAFRGGFVK